MASVRAATKDHPSTAILQQYCGGSYYKFIWSDFPGRIFCRYEHVTLQLLADMRAVGNSFLPEDDFETHGAIPEGSLPFLGFVRARCGDTMADKLASLCDSRDPRNEYLKAYLTWVQDMQRGLEPIQEDTGVSRMYREASTMASRLTSTQGHGFQSMEYTTDMRSTRDSRIPTSRATISDRTHANSSSGCCSIL